MHPYRRIHFVQSILSSLLYLFCQALTQQEVSRNDDNIALNDGYYGRVYQEIPGNPSSDKCGNVLYRTQRGKLADGHAVDIPISSIVQDGNVCYKKDDGNNYVRLQRMPITENILSVGYSRELIQSFSRSHSVQFWVGETSSVSCACYHFPKHLVVFIVRDGYETLSGPLGFPLRAKFLYIIFTNDEFTCIFRHIPPPSNSQNACVSPQSKTTLPSLTPIPAFPSKFSSFKPSSSPHASKSLSSSGTPSVSSVGAQTESARACFPANATVQLWNGSTIEIRYLQIGDQVYVSRNETSSIFMFTHRLIDKQKHEFIKICVEDNRCIRLTKGHYLYVNNGSLIPAERVTLGHRLNFVCNTDKCSSAIKTLSVVNISKVFTNSLYNPQTLHGDLVIDQFRVSTYTSLFSPFTAHSLLTPIRCVYRAALLFKKFYPVNN